MSTVRGERDQGYLELPKSLEYAYGDSVKHIIKFVVWYTHLINTYCVYKSVL